MPFYKNTASQYLHLYATDYNGDGLAGETLTTTILLDNGSFASTTNSAVDETGGVYSLLLAQAETNAGSITVLTSTSTSTAEVATVIISTISLMTTADVETACTTSLNTAMPTPALGSVNDLLTIAKLNTDSIEDKIDIVDTNVDSVLVDTSTTLDAKMVTLQTTTGTLATDITLTKVADAVWNEVLNAGAFNITDSAGKRLRQIEDVTSLGDGSVSVSHDYNNGSTTYNLIITISSVPVDNVQITAFLKTDYDAGSLGSVYVKGSTTTDVDGKWESPLLLDAGTYTIRAYKQGVMQAMTTEVLVV